MWTAKQYYGDSKRQDISSNFNLPLPFIYRFWVLEATTSGLNVDLPDARLLPLGWSICVLVNVGVETITIRDGADGTITTLATSEMAEFGLYGNSTAAGNWTFVKRTAGQAAQVPTDFVFIVPPTGDDFGLWNSDTDSWFADTFPESFGVYRGATRAADKAYFGAAPSEFREYVFNSVTTKTDSPSGLQSVLFSISSKVLNKATAVTATKEWDTTDTWVTLSGFQPVSSDGAGTAQGNPPDAGYFIKMFGFADLAIIKYIRSTDTYSTVGLGGELTACFEHPAGTDNASPFNIDTDRVHFVSTVNGTTETLYCHKAYDINLDAWNQENDIPNWTRGGRSTQHPKFKDRGVFEIRHTSSLDPDNGLFYEWDNTFKAYTQRASLPVILEGSAAGQGPYLGTTVPQV